MSGLLLRPGKISGRARRVAAPRIPPPRTQLAHLEGSFVRNSSDPLENEATQALLRHARLAHGSAVQAPFDLLPKSLETRLCVVAGPCAFVGEVAPALDDGAAGRLEQRLDYIECASPPRRCVAAGAR